MSLEKKKEQLLIDYVNKQYEIAGVEKNYQYALKHEKWYEEHKISEEDNLKLKKWFISECRKRLKYSKMLSEKTWSWTNLMFGFSILYKTNEI